MGPFQQKYLALCQEIHGVYDNAKEFHAKGIEMLIKVRLQLSAWAVLQHLMPPNAKACHKPIFWCLQEFAYHPAFKRFNDTFTATPFKPL